MAGIGLVCRLGAVRAVAGNAAELLVGLGAGFGLFRRRRRIKRLGFAGRLRGQIDRNVLQVVFIDQMHDVGHALHVGMLCGGIDRTHALAGLDVQQLRQQIFLVLSGKGRIGLDRPRALDAVAGDAGLGLVELFAVGNVIGRCAVSTENAAQVRRDNGFDHAHAAVP